MVVVVVVVRWAGLRSCIKAAFRACERLRDARVRWGVRVREGRAWLGRVCVGCKVNARGTFLTTKLALPHLLKSKFTPHVLTLSPPLNLDPEWLRLTGTGAVRSHTPPPPTTTTTPRRPRHRLLHKTLVCT